MPGADLVSVVEAAVTEKLERLEAKRFGKTHKPRKSIEQADTSPGSRYISAPVKRFVFDRDGGKCTFVDDDGRRCTAQVELEYHHHDPYGSGGSRGAENISLMCSTHNLLMAERDLGKDVMDHYRRSDDRVSEPLPAYGVPDSLRPERVVLGTLSRLPGEGAPGLFDAVSSLQGFVLGGARPTVSAEGVVVTPASNR